MIKKIIYVLFAFVLFVLSACQSEKQKKMDKQTEKNKNSATTNSELEQKVDSVLALLSLEEKIGQMNQYTGRGELTGNIDENSGSHQIIKTIRKGLLGSMLNVTSVSETRATQKVAVEESPHGIPLLFAYDVIHGYKTIFPIPLAETASWDLEAAKLSASIAAKEAAAAGLHWTFAPMVDISRDARWGRVMEGAGEDTYLCSLFAKARVEGFQGNDLANENTVAACAKHFAAYGFVEAGRDYNTVDISKNTLRNVVLPPFKACIDAGVATFMNAFNEIGGVPATGSEYLQRDILKNEWNFDGFVVSDWASIKELIYHGVAKDSKEAALIALKAGSDMDMEGNCYVEHLSELVKEGKVDEKLIDDAVRRILRLKFRLGLFDDPYKYCSEEREKSNIYTDEHLKAARHIARKSIVLLKNDDNLLPIAKNIQSIAVIGALAADKDTPIGSWRAQGEKNSAISLLEGLQEAVNHNIEIKYVEGYSISKKPTSFVTPVVVNQSDSAAFDKAADAAKNADMVILAVGETAFQSGEGRSRSHIKLPGLQEELIDRITAANPNTAIVLMNGRPLDLTQTAQKAKAILEVWHLGSQAGHAIADVLLGKYNPSGKLPMSFPRTTGQCPIYYNHKNTGRPHPRSDSIFWTHYTDVPNTPLYPFGYGLSYTSFAYSDIKLSKNEITMNEVLTASIEVTNTGDTKGTEVVQLYIRDLVGSITRPVKELKGFERIELAADETKEIRFEISSDDLAFYGAHNEFKAETGDFKLFIGGNSVDVKQAEFALK